MVPSATLETLLKQRTREGELYEKLPEKRVRCSACGHRCVILDGLPGICKVRFNREGTLFVPAGYVGALQCDPVEKKPFFHAMPGSLAMSFGMLGCDYHCAYCQNWITSQALRDPRSVSSPEDLTAQDLVQLSLRSQARILASTYNEPLITSEWAVEVFSQARRLGIKTAYISNGNGTPEVLEFLHPWLDMYKVDLKSFRDKNYRKLGGRIDPVLDTIQRLHQMGIWLEIVTLIVPGFNDSNEELTETARFLAAISADIPWHVTAFHRDYKMTDPDNTPREYTPASLRDRQGGRPSLCLCRQPARQDWQMGEYLLSSMPHSPDRAPWFSRFAEPCSKGKLSALSHCHPRNLELIKLSLP